MITNLQSEDTESLSIVEGHGGAHISSWEGGNIIDFVGGLGTGWDVNDRIRCEGGW